MLKNLLILLGIGIAIASCQPKLSQTSTSPNGPLIPVVRDDRWGFINQAGEEVIPLKFRSVGQFTDSLAPARLNGRWGYINMQGEYAIQPGFDYATEFSEGFALVWENGKPDFINPKGQKIWTLPDSILHITKFENGKAHLIIQKNGKKEGLLLFRDAGLKPYEPDAPDSWPEIIIRKVPAKNEGNSHTDYAVRDSTGKILVPFGTYATIDVYHGDFAQISIDGAKFSDFRIGFIDRQGKLRFMLPKGSFVFDAWFSEGLIPVLTKAAPSDDELINDDDFITWYDTTGHAVFAKPKDHDSNLFHHGRTFAGNIRKWYLMDKKGARLGNNWFKWVVDDDFSDNMAIVAAFQPKELEVLDINLYGVIDSMGNYLIQPQYNEVLKSGFQQEGLLVAVNEPIRQEHLSPEFKPVKKYWGLIDRKGNWIFKPKFTKIDPNGFENGLLYTEIDSLYGYVTPKGKFIWSAVHQDSSAQPKSLNIDYMLRAYCYADDTQTAKWTKSGANMAHNNARSTGFQPNQLGIYVNDKEPARFNKSYNAWSAYVYNTRADTLKIDVQDNCLYIRMQALNPKGEWQNIEYLPSSWCGNSYYHIALQPDQYWKFDIPVYDGDYPTLLRLAFSPKRNPNQSPSEENTIYSNTFAGKVNPGQFWREEGHTPANIMDPYNN